MKTNEEIISEIKGEFKKAPHLPESLSKENILEKLQSIEQEKKSSETNIFKTIMSVAAVFAIIILSAFAMDIIDEGVDMKAPGVEELKDEQTTVAAQTQDNSPALSTEVLKDSTTIKSDILKKAESDEKLRKLFNRLEITDEYVDVNTYYKGDSASPNMAPTMAPTAETESLVADSLTGTRYFSSTTNVQVNGVDEADIIKSDGRYFYIAAYDKSGYRKLKILDSETMTYIYNDYFYDEDKNVMSIREMYLYEDVLTVVFGGDYYYGFCYTGSYYGENSEIVIKSFDVSDKTKPVRPVFTRKVTQEGDYISSRMIGSVLYTVSRYSVPYTTQEELNVKYAPRVNGGIMSCDCIFIENEESNTYMCLTAYDTKNPEADITMAAILTDADTVFCSAETLYTVGRKSVRDGARIKDVSTVNSFKLEGLSVEHTAKGNFDGVVLNQYSLDEYNDNLRVAASLYDYEESTNKNLIYIFDKGLKLIGELKGIADGEEIKSVRFMGDEGYMVTYLNTDPLFCFDLSDPTSPKITGELKLPGYSTYLHSVGENLLLGIGYGGTELSADVSRLKLSLFDISDMKNPKEVSQLEFLHSSSDALDNPKSFLFDNNKNYLYLPVIKGTTDWSCKVIALENKKLKVIKDIEHDAFDTYVDYDFFRTAYIGDEIYAISSSVVTKYDFAEDKTTVARSTKEEEMNYSEGVDDSLIGDVVYAVTTPPVAGAQ